MRKEDELARHALRLLSDDGDRVFALIGMSDAKWKNEDRDGSVELLNEATELAEAVPQLTFRAPAYNEIGKRYHVYGESETASDIFARALASVAASRDERSKAGALASLAQIFQEARIDPTDEHRESIRGLLFRSA